MTRRFILYSSLVLLFGSGCGLRSREEALKQKEAAFAEREKQLQFKEKSLQLKEQELMIWKQQLDSIKRDTAQVYDNILPGKWNVKMTCIETSCGGSAIGDSKSETWEFTYQNRNLLVKAIAGEKLARIYTGSFDGIQITLKEDVANTAAAPITKILVTLRLAGNNSMEGQRDIIRENDCVIVYKLQLNKQ